MSALGTLGGVGWFAIKTDCRICQFCCLQVVPQKNLAQMAARRALALMARVCGSSLDNRRGMRPTGGFWNFFFLRMEGFERALISMENILIKSHWIHMDNEVSVSVFHKILENWWMQETVDMNWIWYSTSCIFVLRYDTLLSDIWVTRVQELHTGRMSLVMNLPES